MKITIIQTDIVWENSNANIEKYNSIISKLGDTDLVIFPEMFTSGFSMDVAKNAEPLSGTTVSWMKQTAIDNNLAIIGSLPIHNYGEYYNRLIMTTPDSLNYYDKRHLFSMGDEHKNFTAGNSRKIFELNGWRILPLVCYDIRFPVWSRNKNDYDLLIYIANWPKVRADVWKTLLKARAIENQCYVIGVNRVGIDGNKMNYAGESMVIDAKGEVLLNLEDKENYDSITLSLDKLNNFRKVFPVHSDSDDFRLL